MSIRKQLAVGAALAAVPVLALASPAAAAEGSGYAESVRNVTFQFQGQQVTCTLRAASGFEANDPQESDSTYGWGQTIWDGGEKCGEALLFMNLGASYRNEEGEHEFVSTASTKGPDLFMSFNEAGSITDMVGTHSVTYRCDTGHDGTCTTDVVLNPK